MISCDDLWIVLGHILSWSNLDFAICTSCKGAKMSVNSWCMLSRSSFDYDFILYVACIVCINDLCMLFGNWVIKNFAIIIIGLKAKARNQHWYSRDKWMVTSARWILVAFRLHVQRCRILFQGRNLFLRFLEQTLAYHWGCQVSSNHCQLSRYCIAPLQNLFIPLICVCANWRVFLNMIYKKCLDPHLAFRDTFFTGNSWKSRWVHGSTSERVKVSMLVNSCIRS